MFGKDKEKRLSDTLDYISKTVSPSHKNVVEQKIGNRRDASSKISLGFRGVGVKNPLETQRRRALRALMLSLQAFGYPEQVKKAKEYYIKKREVDIRDAINSFCTDTKASDQKVVDAARRIKLQLGGINYKQVYKYRRGALGPSLGGGNCYAGVAQWIYVGGIVSLRWLEKHGEMNVGIGTDTAPKSIFNWLDKKVTTEALAESINAGRLVYFSRYAGKNKTTVHYALSNGGGKCIGINNPLEVEQKWHPNFTTDKMKPLV